MTRVELYNELLGLADSLDESVTAVIASLVLRSLALRIEAEGLTE